MYVSHHFGGDLGDYQSEIAWFWSVPSVYLLAVPAAGVALDVVPALSRNRLRMHGAALAVVGLVATVVSRGIVAHDPEPEDVALAGALPGIEA